MFLPLIKDTPGLPPRVPARLWVPFPVRPAPRHRRARRAEQMQRPVVVLVASSTEAHTLERELPLFLPHPVPILTLPDWETLPYDHFSPHQDIVSRGSAPSMSYPSSARHRNTASHHRHVANTPQHYIEGNTLDLSVGDTFDDDSFAKSLALNGYRAVETVFEHGEFAVRGALLDVFPMGSDKPYRIDLLDDEVETLRTFDPETQRTVDRVKQIKLMPAREFPIGGDATHRFQMAWFESFDGDADLCPAFTEISAGRVPGGANATCPVL